MCGGAFHDGTVLHPGLTLYNVGEREEDGLTPGVNIHCRRRGFTRHQSAKGHACGKPRSRKKASERRTVGVCHFIAGLHYIVKSVSVVKD